MQYEKTKRGTVLPIRASLFALHIGIVFQLSISIPFISTCSSHKDVQRSINKKTSPFDANTTPY